MKPVLQIIHVSDMHVVADGFVVPGVIRTLERAAASVGWTWLRDKLRDGTAPHDTFAPLYFRRFVQQVSAADPIWNSCPTWIVDTGDQTTFGDAASIVQAQAELDGFLRAATPGAFCLRDLHGNHDAWPETLPLVGAVAIPVHSAAIAKTYRCGDGRLALRAPLPSGGEVQLYAVDSVNDHFWENTVARGEVRHPQADDVIAHARANKSASAPDLRILSVHHPVHHPPPKPGYEMVLANAHTVATSFANGAPMHLVMSGHTHDLFPEHGALPAHANQCQHAPLGPGQMQLVAGTLMQVDRLGNRAYAHQAQLLRLYQDPATPDVVLIERFLVARGLPSTQGQPNPGGVGDYKIVPISDQNEAEEVLVQL